MSLRKTKEIQKLVADHLGAMKRYFENGTLSDEDVDNTDETHLIIDLDNRRTFGFLWAMKSIMHKLCLMTRE